MVVITANPAATSTTLTSSRTSAIYGQSVTFTAVVAGLGMPTGTVTFYAGVVSRADQIGTGTLSVVNGHDQAAISVSTLKVNGSPYAITAVYSGDSSDQGSTSNSLSETITADPSTTSAHASATADPFGQTITVTATVAASAPGSGTPTGTVDFLDTTTGDDLATIALTGGTAALSVASLTPGSHSIKVSYSGDGNFTASSTTTSTITVNRSIIVLDPTAAAALDISGNASISLTGGVYVDSNSTNALAASGNAQISASLIAVVGGVQKSGNATFHPAPITKVAPLPDPLWGLPAPGATGLTSYGSYSLSGNSRATISPGIYNQIAVSDNANLTLNSGLYIIEGGGFLVSYNASVSGAGVTIFNTGSNFPAAGGAFGAISLSGNGTISLQRVGHRPLRRHPVPSARG